jgi:nucleotide-binding universal stress UspA family protein
MTAPRHLLLPTDLTPHAAEVLDYAASLAARLGASIHVLHAFTPPVLDRELPEDHARKIMDEILAGERAKLDQLVAPHAELGRIASVKLELGDAVPVILAVAERLRPEMIVMGTHGRRGLSRIVMGSVAESVARAATCPVLLFREP